MLQKMLLLIHSRNIQTQQEMAAALNVTPELVSLMIQQLVSSGYLQPLSECGISDTHNTSCDACSTRAGCALSSLRSGWMLTERGEKLIASNIS